VEPVLGGHEYRTLLALILPLPVAPDQFDRRLVGLGAGVGEENPGVGRPGTSAQEQLEPFSKIYFRFVQEQVGAMRDRVHLPGDRGGESRVRVPQRAHRDPGEQVEVLAPVGVPDPAAFTAGQGQRRQPVVGHQGGGEPFLQYLRRAHG
jgi:hypothetical protein